MNSCIDVFNKFILTNFPKSISHPFADLNQTRFDIEVADVNKQYSDFFYQQIKKDMDFPKFYFLGE